MEREIRKFDVVGIFDDAGFRIDGTRARDAGSPRLLRGGAAFRKKLFAKLRHIADDGLRSSLRECGHRAFFYDGIIFVDDSDGDIGSAEVDAYAVFHAITPFCRFRLKCDGRGLLPYDGRPAA